MIQKLPERYQRANLRALGFDPVELVQSAVALGLARLPMAKPNGQVRIVGGKRKCVKHLDLVGLTKKEYLRQWHLKTRDPATRPLAGEIRLNKWVEMTAARLGIKAPALKTRMRRGQFPMPVMRRANSVVVFVKISAEAGEVVG